MPQVNGFDIFLAQTEASTYGLTCLSPPWPPPAQMQMLQLQQLGSGQRRLLLAALVLIGCCQALVVREPGNTESSRHLCMYSF